MTRPPSHPQAAAPGIAAVLGGMLCALLAALLGSAGTRRPGNALSGAMAGVLRAIQDADDAIDGEPEEYVEWIAVPAPWRAGQGHGPSCARIPRLARRFVRLGAWGRGPPGPIATFGPPKTRFA